MLTRKQHMKTSNRHQRSQKTYLSVGPHALRHPSTELHEARLPSHLIFLDRLACICIRANVVCKVLLLQIFIALYRSCMNFYIWRRCFWYRKTHTNRPLSNPCRVIKHATYLAYSQLLATSYLTRVTETWCDENVLSAALAHTFATTASFSELHLSAPTNAGCETVLWPSNLGYEYHLVQHHDVRSKMVLGKCSLWTYIARRVN